MSRLKYYVPPILWMAAIFIFSTSAFSSGSTESLLGRVIGFFWPGHPIRHLLVINYFVRKTAHVLVYGVLALLVYRAEINCSGISGRKALLVALFICMVFSFSDEAHQLLVPGRTGKPADAALDTCGAAIALLGLSPRIKRKAPST